MTRGKSLHGQWGQHASGRPYWIGKPRRRLTTKQVFILIIVLILAVCGAAVEISRARAHHPAAVVVAPIIKALGGSSGGAIGGAGAGVSVGAVAAVGVIGVAAVAAVVDLSKKKCNRSHDTWVDTKHDVNQPAKYKQWRDPCKRVKKRAAAPAKSLWPDGK